MKRYSTVIFGTPSLPAGTTDIEANTHNELGDLYTMAGKIEDRTEVLIHFNRYRDLSASIGDALAVHDAEVKITFAESMYGFSKKKTDATQINALREQHKQDPNHFNRGVNLALALDAEGCGIECQRLTTKLLASCRRVNGPNHDTTNI